MQTTANFPLVQWFEPESQFWPLVLRTQRVVKNRYTRNTYKFSLSFSISLLNLFVHQLLHGIWEFNCVVIFGLPKFLLTQNQKYLCLLPYWSIISWWCCMLLWFCALLQFLWNSLLICWYFFIQSLLFCSSCLPAAMRFTLTDLSYFEHTLNSCDQ
jgi:hypothetical protein